MRFEEILAKFPDAKKSGDGWIAKCTGHTDGTASLSISEGADGRTLLHCHAGCTPQAICDARDLTLADLFPAKESRNCTGKPKRNGSFEIVAAYDYRDETGNLLSQVCRLNPKDFRQRRPDATAPDGWTWKTAGVKKVLFRLPEIIRDVSRGTPIFICEGEKDVLVMVQKGFAATCNPGGAGKWLDSYSETLRGADVCIIADKDKAGRDHAQLVAGKLHGVAKSVRVLELPDTNGKPVKDAADFFAAGGTAGKIFELVDVAPIWTPQADKSIGTVMREIISAADQDDATFEQITAGMQVEMLRALNDKNMPPAEARRRISRIAIETMLKIGRFYFHAELRSFDACYFFNRFTKRLERLHADSFLAWLSDWLCQNRTDSAFKFLFADIENAALCGKSATGILPESFWASRPGAIYLSSGDGQLVKITAAGVALADNGTDAVLFPVGRTCQPWQLIPPKDIFQTCGIFRDVHAIAGHAPDLLRAWIYSLPSNPKSKPPLCLAGEVGSGKTRLAKAIAEFFGIPFVAAKVEESEESNFWPSIDGGGIFTMDNADTKCRWLADALANAATDGASQRRKLYTNSETVTLRARAWLCVTTANPTFAADSGLADRLLLVRMARRDDQETSDGLLTDEILANRDAGLSHLAETIRAALADTAPTPAGLNQRHPDFSAFAVRVGRALNREAQMIAAMKNAEADKSLFCLENDSIGAALLACLADGATFTGTAAELREKIIGTDADLADKLSAKRLGKRLAILWPHLKKQLATANHETGRGRIITYTLKIRPSGECGEFEMPFSQNPLRETQAGTLSKTPFETHQTHQTNDDL